MLQTTDCGTGTIIEHKGELVAVKMDNGFVLWIDVNQVEILPENGECQSDTSHLSP